ncbi:uncharacterized protein LOC144352787 [Saccoglossus kowalevskii]
MTSPNEYWTSLYDTGSGAFAWQTDNRMLSETGFTQWVPSPAVDALNLCVKMISTSSGDWDTSRCDAACSYICQFQDPGGAATTAAVTTGVSTTTVPTTSITTAAETTTVPTTSITTAAEITTVPTTSITTAAETTTVPTTSITTAAETTTVPITTESTTSITTAAETTTVPITTESTTSITTAAETTTVQTVTGHPTSFYPVTTTTVLVQSSDSPSTHLDNGGATSASIPASTSVAPSNATQTETSISDKILRALPSYLFSGALMAVMSGLVVWDCCLLAKRRRRDKEKKEEKIKRSAEMMTEFN